MSPRSPTRRFRRWAALAWLGAALNALSPVVAYAHSASLPGGLFHDHFASEVADAQHAHHHHHPDGGTAPPEHSKHPSAPHCPYCPGFAAGMALAQFALVVIPEVHPAVAHCSAHRGDPALRGFVRNAQPRAPPALS